MWTLILVFLSLIPSSSSMVSLTMGDGIHTQYGLYDDCRKAGEITLKQLHMKFGDLQFACVPNNGALNDILALPKEFQ